MAKAPFITILTSVLNLISVRSLWAVLNRVWGALFKVNEVQKEGGHPL